jgi:CSLREA domain-containing protein
VRAAALTIAAVAVAGAVLAPGAWAATITPTVTTDDLTVNGNCTLREAVQAASGNGVVDQCTAGEAAAPDTIVLSQPLYNLTHTGTNDNSNLTGDLDVFLNVAGPLTIAGHGLEATIDGGNADRVIDVATTTASSLTLNDVRLDRGNPPFGSGGALRVPGANSVTLNDSRVTRSSSNATGGGIQVAGDLTLNRSTVSGNASSATTGALGAGIFSGGDLMLDSSTVSGNHIDAPDDAVTDVVLGGGIAAQAGSIDLLNSTIAGNAVDALDSADTAGGGGIYAESVPVTITNSTFSGNSVTDAGFSVAGGLFFRDTAATKHFLKIQNSTFSGNSSQSQAGAIQIFDGISGVRSSTFSGNTSGGGRAIVYDDFADPISSVQIGATILSDGGAGECAGADALTTNGFNIDRGTSCALTGTGDLQNTNPGLLTLASNGGPTQTNALPTFPLSPALDRIPAASCTQINTTPLTIDQRGAPRGFDEDGDGIAECDVGAYELNRCQGAIVNVLGASAINGTTGSDGILGSPGFDLIDPKEGNDKVCAGEGDDNIIERPGGGTDALDGAGGSDTVALGNGTGGPAGTIDLAAGTGSIPSGTGTTMSLGSIENATGSVQGDTLIGGSGPNTLDGGIGNDTIDGGPGADTLLGGTDNDRMLARDGFGDTVDCGPGTADSAQTDRLSLDLVSGCEGVDALVEPEPPSSPPSSDANAKKKCKKKHRRSAASARKRCKKPKR